MNLLYWLEPWEPSPTVVIAIAVAAVLFVRGQRKARVSFARRLSFWLGLTGLYVALHTRLDYFFEHEFFMHRAQHLVLHHLGPFFIALAYPGAALRAGIPFAWRQRFVRPALAARPVRAVVDVLMHPVVAVVLFVGLIYFWLLSPIHFMAMLDWRLYRVMNWSMVIDGLMFWWLVLDSRPAPPARLSPGRRVLIVIAAIPPQIVLGAFIFFSPRELYPIYSICGRAFTWLSPLRDQQIGGLLLWIPGSMMSVLGAVLALRHWMRLSARARLREERVGMAPVAARHDGDVGGGITGKQAGAASGKTAKSSA
ncbi:putative membrane protein [Paraburkholderia kururiensis]|uniref:cytochrome c oxidase assembly protein n=1 Tax=Paraburkholderia TaxID=1822464 RepID=UPI0024080074|nr:cytochrome c oxidase assembly protein [Paraburkholderia sp. SUR17]WEY40545.1 cytochrome c oxidase assembly protein [Paraburkholderia sp. SUR17]